jgi:hypothetical protein
MGGLPLVVLRHPFFTLGMIHSWGGQHKDSKQKFHNNNMMNHEVDGIYY